MSSLNKQPEDNKNVQAAKMFAAGELNAGALEQRRLFIAITDDRSDWIAKCAELRDTMIDAASQFTPGNEVEKQLISLMAGQVREVSAMLNPPK